VGFVASLPLFAAYECGLLLDPSLRRNGAEACLSFPLSLVDPGHAWPRILGLLAVGLLALLHLRRKGVDLWPSLRGTLGYGVLAGLLLGPALVLLSGFFEAPPGQALHWDVPAGLPASPPGLFAVLRLMGGAAWEEILFRVGFLGLLYLLAFRSATFLGVRASFARLLAELLGILGSAFLFGTFHLDPVQRNLGLSGEPFALEVFLWRVLAGTLLGGLFRWKGMGVAAWAHALLNVGLALGAGPGVFR